MIAVRPHHVAVSCRVCAGFLALKVTYRPVRSTPIPERVGLELEVNP
jgi:hypothetical protein